MNQDNFIWNSPRESRVYCVYENRPCLQKVFSSLLNFKNFRFDPNTTYHKSYGRVINPKSLTIHQLYGLFDPKTHEWTDGVLGSTFREYANNTAEERKWIVMDGPVDPGLKYLGPISDLNRLLDCCYQTIGFGAGFPRSPKSNRQIGRLRKVIEIFKI